MGGAVKSDLEWQSQALGFEVGYASGDTNRYDDVKRTFQFDPNYRVGMILFPILNATQSHIAIENAGDPNYRAQLPRGVDRTATAGVENAVYVYPTFMHRLNNSTKLAIAYLYAWRATPHFDIFRSALNGGVPTSHLGRTHTRSLGQEVNLGLTKSISEEAAAIQLKLLSWAVSFTHRHLGINGAYLCIFGQRRQHGKRPIILALAIVGCDAQLDKTELGLPSGEGPRIVLNPLTLPLPKSPCRMT